MFWKPASSLPTPLVQELKPSRRVVLEKRRRLIQGSKGNAGARIARTQQNVFDIDTL